MKSIKASQDNNIFVKITVLIVLVLLLSVRGDGYFPFPDSSDPKLMSWFSALQIFGIAILLYFFFNSKNLAKRIPNQLTTMLSVNKLLLITVITLSTLSVVLIVKNYLNFKPLYQISYLYTFLGLLVSFSLFCWGLFKQKLLLTISGVVLVTLTLSLIQIQYFPITAKIGDLMPIVQKQAEAFWNGDFLYQYFLLDNGVETQAVRQPGTPLLFSPAYLVGVDFRFMSLFWMFATIVLLFKLGKSDNRKENSQQFTTLLVVLFLLFPFRLNRLDLYEPPFWFLFALAIWFLAKKKYKPLSIVWGIGIFTQVWFWLFTPFLGVYLLQKVGFKKAVVYTISSLILGGGLILLLIYQNPSAYLEHAFGFYKDYHQSQNFVSHSLYLTSLLQIYKLASLSTILQLTSVGIVGITYLLKQSSKLTHMIQYMALGYFVFVIFNSLTWNYMYINLVLILIIYAIVGHWHQKEPS